MKLMCTWTRGGRLVMVGDVSGRRYEFESGFVYDVPEDIRAEDVDRFLAMTFSISDCRCNGKVVPEAVLQNNKYFQLIE